MEWVEAQVNSMDGGSEENLSGQEEGVDIEETLRYSTRDILGVVYPAISSSPCISEGSSIIIQKCSPPNYNFDTLMRVAYAFRAVRPRAPSSSQPENCLCQSPPLTLPNLERSSIQPRHGQGRWEAP